MRAKLLEETRKYFRGGDPRQHFPDIENKDAYRISTLLDTRYRKNGFSSQNKADAGENCFFISSQSELGT